MTDEPETYHLKRYETHFCVCGRGFESLKGLNIHLSQTDARHYPREGTIPKRPPEPLPVYWNQPLPSRDIEDRPILTSFFHGYTRYHGDEKQIMSPLTFRQIGKGRMSRDNQLYKLQPSGKFLLYRSRH